MCAFDETARFEIETFFAMFQGQFNAVANKWLARQQAFGGGLKGSAKGVDQADTGRVASDEDRRARLHVGIDAFSDNHTIIDRGGLFDLPLEIFERQTVVTQRMCKVKDWVVEILTMDTA